MQRSHAIRVCYPSFHLKRCCFRCFHFRSSLTVLHIALDLPSKQHVISDLTSQVEPGLNVTYAYDSPIYVEPDLKFNMSNTNDVVSCSNSLRIQHISFNVESESSPIPYTTTCAQHFHLFRILLRFIPCSTFK